MQVPDLAGGQLQVAEHDVLDAGAEVALAPRRHLDRASAEQVQHHRDVVHAQAPERVFVLADHAQVLAVAVHVQHVAELARFDQLTQLDHGRVEPQQVADHHDPRPLGGQGLQLPGLGDRPGQRLLHEHVLAGQQGAPGQGVVGGHRCRHDHRVQRLVLDQVVEASRHPGLGELRREPGLPLLVRVAAPDQLGAGQLREVAGQVRAPVAEADDAHAKAIAHSTCTFPPSRGTAFRKSNTSWARPARSA